MNDPNFEYRDEFEWEQALRDSDEYAAHYFRLLKRFSDLPESDELIAEQLEAQFRDRMPNCDFDCDNCPYQWSCDFAQYEDDADDDFEQFLNDSGESRSVQPGDDVYFETHPAFAALRQCAFGWCNIYATVLPPENRREGLTIMFLIGRAMSNLASSIGDGLFEQPSASIAFTKRSLAQLNDAVGHMTALTADKPHLSRLLKAMNEHLLKARNAIYDHLQFCRQKTSTEND